MERQSYLLVIPWPSHFAGGVNVAVKGLAAALRTESGFEPIIAIDTWGERRGRFVEGELLYQFGLIGADNPRARLRALMLLPWRLWRLRRLLASMNAAVVNFHYVTDSALGVALLKRLGLYDGSLVLSFHGTDARLPSEPLMRFAHRVVLGTADAIIAVSHGLSTRISTTTGVDPASISVVLNGVDLSVFRPDATAPASPSFLVPSDFVLSIGSYIPRKNLASLLQAFSHLADRHPGLMLCIAGAEGPELEPLRKQAAKLRLAERVHFFVSLQPQEVAHLIARARLVVQPALSEGLPLAVLEAGAVGTPLAVSDIPGHDELVQDGVTGRLFPPGNDAACALAIEDVLAHPSEARAAANRLRERVIRKFTWSRCVRNYLSVLKLDRKPPQALAARSSPDSVPD